MDTRKHRKKKADDPDSKSNLKLKEDVHVIMTQEFVIPEDVTY
jgi:hypothetical protein